MLCVCTVTPADKLKGFGNTILGKFGLSLDNFKMQQDPSTGPYPAPVRWYFVLFVASFECVLCICIFPRRFVQHQLQAVAMTMHRLSHRLCDTPTNVIT
jgi:hypothetical protein